jgi:hypothetical protein
VTSAQTIVIAVLWVAVLGLMALVLLLYRQVDRAYAGGRASKTGGLKPGVQLPEVTIISDDGVGALELPGGPEPSLLAFVSLDCDGCNALMKTLARRKAFNGTVMAVVVEGIPRGLPVPDLPPEVTTYAAHSGAQLRRALGITVVPLVYVLRGRTVLATGTVATDDEVRDLLETARKNDADLRDVALSAEGNALPDVVPVGSGRRDG